MHVTYGSGREQGLPRLLRHTLAGCLGYSHLGNYPNFLKACENVLSKSYQFP